MVILFGSILVYNNVWYITLLSRTWEKPCWLWTTAQRASIIKEHRSHPISSSILHSGLPNVLTEALKESQPHTLPSKLWCHDFLFWSCCRFVQWRNRKSHSTTTPHGFEARNKIRKPDQTFISCATGGMSPVRYKHTGTQLIFPLPRMILKQEEIKRNPNRRLNKPFQREKRSLHILKHSDRK